MVKKAEDVFKDALALNADERAQLVKLLIEQTAAVWTTPEIEQARHPRIPGREDSSGRCANMRFDPIYSYPTGWNFAGSCLDMYS
jgi:hypothetical protein